ncbi:MAG: MGMT family protein [Bdellovibrionales bacterium]
MKIAKATESLYTPWAKFLSPFTEKVIQVVRSIPRGRVATYKQVAALAGHEHASRGVAWILNSCSRKYNLPWHRVLSSQGRISFRPTTHNFTMQRKLLCAEGVEVDAGGRLDMVRFQWRKKSRTRRRGKSPRLLG